MSDLLENNKSLKYVSNVFWKLCIIQICKPNTKNMSILSNALTQCSDGKPNDLNTENLSKNQYKPTDFLFRLIRRQKRLFPPSKRVSKWFFSRTTQSPSETSYDSRLLDNGGRQSGVGPPGNEQLPWHHCDSISERNKRDER